MRKHFSGRGTALPIPLPEICLAALRILSTLPQGEGELCFAVRSEGRPSHACAIEVRDARGGQDFRREQARIDAHTVVS